MANLNNGAEKIGDIIPMLQMENLKLQEGD